MAGGESAEICWQGPDVPVSAHFDDPFYSLDDGAAEAAHVFLAGNDLPARFRAGFHIGELGFGTGLNALVARRAWRETGQAGALRFTSFEAYPIEARDMGRALARWPELEGDDLVTQWEASAREISLPGLELQVIVGDARTTVPDWSGRADAWFLDGFSPAKNPAMWEPPLLNAVAVHSVPGGTCATYSAAAPVRSGLREAGFSVERRPGYGRKRHMSVGRL